MELAHRVAGLPRDAVLETKRRTRLERDRLWGFLFEDERRAFHRALLGEEPSVASSAPQVRSAADRPRAHPGACTAGRRGSPARLQGPARTPRPADRRPCAGVELVLAAVAPVGRHQARVAAGFARGDRFERAERDAGDGGAVARGSHSGRGRSRSAPTPAPGLPASRAAASAPGRAPAGRPRRRQSCRRRARELPTAAMIRLRLAGKGEPPPLAALFCPRRRVAWRGPPCPLGPRSPREASRRGGLYV